MVHIHLASGVDRHQDRRYRRACADPISRASVTMAKCMEMNSGAEQGKTGTDG